jgi:hypothetical protein
LKLYKAMEFPTLMHGREAWALAERSLPCIESTEMRYRRSVKECTRIDRILNLDIMSELTEKKSNK